MQVWGANGIERERLKSFNHLSPSAQSVGILRGNLNGSLLPGNCSGAIEKFASAIENGFSLKCSASKEAL